jgi:hypothetical protein
MAVKERSFQEPYPNSRYPTGDATGDAVEAAEAGDPLAVAAAYLGRPVVPGASGGRVNGGAPGKGFADSPKIDLPRRWHTRVTSLRYAVLVRREGIEPPTRWL